VREALKEHDDDKDGKLNFAEFVYLYKESKAFAINRPNPFGGAIATGVLKDTLDMDNVTSTKVREIVQLMSHSLMRDHKRQLSASGIQGVLRGYMIRLMVPLWHREEEDGLHEVRARGLYAYHYSDVGIDLCVVYMYMFSPCIR